MPRVREKESDIIYQPITNILYYLTCVSLLAFLPSSPLERSLCLLCFIEEVKKEKNAGNEFRIVVVKMPCIYQFKLWIKSLWIMINGLLFIMFRMHLQTIMYGRSDAYEQKIVGEWEKKRTVVKLKCERKYECQCEKTFWTICFYTIGYSQPEPSWLTSNQAINHRSLVVAVSCQHLYLHLSLIILGVHIHGIGQSFLKVFVCF